jgi:GAF domain-containing protein
MTKAEQYETISERIQLLIKGETDLIARMSTVLCELHNGIEYFHWTGFYRVVGDKTLKVGPYQGGHGCLEISFQRGVCGACAREKKTVIVEDVDQFPGHIACASSTRSEIVLPVFDKSGELMAVLDVDSNNPSAFDTTDAHWLEKIVQGIY